MVGGLILAALTLSAGVFVYQVMQHQTRSILSNNLQTSLAHHVRLYDSQLQQGLADARALQPRISLITNLQRLLDRPGDPHALRELQHRADLLKTTGLESVAIYDTQGNLVGKAGHFVHQPKTRAPLQAQLPLTLLWDGEFILQAQIDIFNDQRQKLGWLLSEKRLPQLMQSVVDAQQMGRSAELALCAPDAQVMQCFPLSRTQQQNLQVARSVTGRALPMYQALQSKTGLAFSQDYRGEPVAAAYAPVGSWGLGMVLKIDQAELYRPAQEQFKLVAPLMLVVLIAGIILLRWLFMPLIRQLVNSEQDKQAANTRLQDLEERWRFALESTGAGVWDLNLRTNQILLSPQCKAMLGYREDEIGTDMTEWTTRIHPDDLPCLLAARQQFLDMDEAYFTNEHRKQCKDGSWKWIQVRGMVVARDDYGKPTRVIGTYIDIEAQKQAEQRILHLASHDALTGLPNRDLLQDRIQQAIIQAHRADNPAALLFIDLDQFKTINDSLGHDMGDLLLQEVAQRLVAGVRSEDTVARQGGDEFIVLLLSIRNAQDAGVLAQKLLTDLLPPFQIRGKELHVSASIGIAVYPDDGADVDTLLKHSDIAMYHAKEVGRNNYQFFTPKMNQLASERLALATDLRHAIGRNQLLLHFQPIVDIASGQLAGMEALLRWQHPERGLIPPLQFISLAEEIGLIGAIGEWVLQSACAQMKDWQDQGYAVPRLSINLSAKQFRQADLAQTVAHILHQTGLNTADIELEMTESLLMENSDDVKENLRQIGEMGLGIAIDDFGTGYSSLSYLKRFTISTLKIDRSFVMDIASDPDDAAIVTAIIALAHSLQMKVVAEGVEDATQLAFLKQHACDRYQGSHFSQALSAADMVSIFQRRLA